MSKRQRPASNHNQLEVRGLCGMATAKASLLRISSRDFVVCFVTRTSAALASQVHQLSNSSSDILYTSARYSKTCRKFTRLSRCMHVGDAFVWLTSSAIDKYSFLAAKPWLQSHTKNGRSWNLELQSLRAPVASRSSQTPSSVCRRDREAGIRDPEVCRPASVA